MLITLFRITNPAPYICTELKGKKKMKTIYLLTLDDEDSSHIGKVALLDNNKEDVIKGINKIMANGAEYYESYADQIKWDGLDNNIQGGSYRDGVRWSVTNIDIEELLVIN